MTLDYSAVTASLALLPFGFSMFVASLLVGRVADRFGFRWPVAAGMALMGIGGLLLSGVEANSDYADLWWVIAIVGTGVGITFSAPSAAGLKALPPEHAGEASGIINVVRYVSAALVISLGTILFVQVGSDELNSALSKSEVRTLEEERLDHVLTGAPTEVSETEAQLGPNTKEAFESGAAEGISRGFAVVCLSIGIACLLAMVAWLVLMRPARAPSSSWASRPRSWPRRGPRSRAGRRSCRPPGRTRRSGPGRRGRRAPAGPAPGSRAGRSCGT